jgi:hypothetical protein
MVITLATLNPSPGGFAANGYSADWSGCEELVAAPASGVSIYLSKILVLCTADVAITIGEGDNEGTVESVLMGPLKIHVGGRIVYEFLRPIKLTAAKSLTADADGAGAATIFVEGFIK